MNSKANITDFFRALFPYFSTKITRRWICSLQQEHKRRIRQSDDLKLYNTTSKKLGKQSVNNNISNINYHISVLEIGVISYLLQSRPLLSSSSPWGRSARLQKIWGRFRSLPLWIKREDSKAQEGNESCTATDMRSESVLWS